jgi:hypothetical protein
MSFNKSKFYEGPVECAGCSKDLTGDRTRMNVHSLIGVGPLREPKPEDPRVCGWECFRLYVEKQKQKNQNQD